MVHTETATASADNVINDVITTVAEEKDVDPLELTPPLYEVIDPDALESLFGNDRTLGKLIFNYSGCEVSVFSDGYISVRSHRI